MVRRFVGIGWFVVVASGCAPSPEKACEAYDALRKKEDYPSGKAIQAECEKELTGVKERSAKAYKEVVACITTGSEVDTVNKCVSSSERLYGEQKEADVLERWKYGVAHEASGAWAEEKSGKLELEHCVEGAPVIAHKKLEYGLLKTDTDERNHTKDLLASCKESKADEAYAKQFRCMRRMESQRDLAACLGQVAAGP